MQFEMEMSSGKTFTSRVNLKIRKDERMQFSILPILGIEAFRVELSPDSLLVIDRLNKRYLSESVARIRKETRAGFNFYSMQALFSNRLFLPDEADVSDKAFERFRWERMADGYALQTQDNAGLQYIFTVGRDEKLYASEITDAGSQYMLRWDYDAFQPVGQQVFPMKIRAGWRTGEKAVGHFSVNYSRVDTDVPVEVNTAIPVGYERVEFSQIKKMFE